MVKLADLPAGLPTVGGQAGTLASGASGREVVQVQVLFFGGKLQQRKYFARMVKLADTLASGASGREVVQVQVLFRAQKGPCKRKGFFFLPQWVSKSVGPAARPTTFSLGVS